MISTDILKDKKFLVVEDNEINRNLTKEILQDVGVTVETAKNGKDAIKKISKAEENYFDFILMDIHMPKMDGYETARKIRALEDKEKAKVPILAVTVDTADEDKQKELDCGINGHLSKPVKISELLETVSQYLKSFNQLAGLMADLT